MKQPIEYIKECLDSVEESLIIEINARDGSVTRKLAEIPGSDVHAFEPLAESPIPNLPSPLTYKMTILMLDIMRMLYRQY